MSAWIAKLNEIGDRFADLVLTRSTVDMARLLTLLLLITHGPKTWYVKGPLIILSLSGLIIRELRARPTFWIFISMFIVAHDIANWPGVDNHKWLIGWWTVALAVTAFAPVREQLASLKFNARMMLGLCFAFATFWKLITPGYMDTGFFEYELVADKRFASVAVWVGGAEYDSLKENRDAKREFADSYRKDAVPDTSIELATGPYINLLALGMTWWTILIEGALAVTALIPGSGLIAITRTLIILVFVACTYLLVPVMGFSWIVIIMGLVQCPERYKKLRASFLPVLGLIYIYRMELVEFVTEIVTGDVVELMRLY